MGKKYLVEEIEGENIIGIFIGGILLIGIFLLINYFFIQTIGENLLNPSKIEAETLGLFIGLSLSLIIGIVIFVIYFKNGFFDAIEKVVHVIAFSNPICMLLGSIIVPMLVYYNIYHKIEFEWGDLLKTLLGNGIIFLLVTPLTVILGIIVIVLIGSIIRFVVYRLIYMILAPRIKKTRCWDYVRFFIANYDVSETVLKIELLPNKIRFYDENNARIKTISFEALGYSKLKRMLQLTLMHLIKKETSTYFKLDVISYESPYEVLVYINRKLNRNLKKEKVKSNKRYIKNKEKMNRLEQKKKKREYKKAVKRGADW